MEDTLLQALAEELEAEELETEEGRILGRADILVVLECLHERGAALGEAVDLTVESDEELEEQARVELAR